MSEAVKVVVKCRPMSRREKDMECKQILDVDSSTGQCSITNTKDSDAPAKTFTFDGAYGGDASNEQLYLDITFPLVESVTEGYNGTVFAYGQTGGGKTYTMQGVTNPTTERGLIPRAFDHIFETVAVAEHTRYLIHASFLEIYNEEVRDLLGDDTKARLELRERPDGQVFVKDLSLHPVASVRACEVIMNRGWKNRATGSTLMNTVSSRSHSIFTIYLERCDDPTNGSKIRASKLNLVDLAGSERQSKTGAMGDRLKEATKINLSLSALGNVISALVDGRSVHIPYRDSKLTRLLQDSLGGNTNTLMIACLSPADSNYEETLSTLRYANRAKSIKNKPRINEDPKDALIRQYLDEISRLKAIISRAPPHQELEVIARPPTPEPQIIERIVHVPDEAEIRAKTEAIVVEYEKKMQKMAAELAEARASSERTAAEMDRLRTEAEQKQRQLHAEFNVLTQSQHAKLRAQYDAEMERVQRELETARRGKEVVQVEMESLRRQYESAMFAVESSVPPQELEAERERLKAEYEANMMVMRDELEAVKTSRDNVEVEMESLRAEFESLTNAGRSALSVASASTSTALLSLANDRELRLQNLTDEMKIVQEADDHRVTTDTNGSKNFLIETGSQTERSASESVQSKLVKDSLFKYSTRGDRKLMEKEQAQPAIDVDQLQKDVTSHHESAVTKLTAELEDFKRSRDDIAKVIQRIKTEYQEAVSRAHDSVPMHEFDLAQQDIRAKYEVRMDPVKNDLEALKQHRDIVTSQLTEQKSTWKRFDEERRQVAKDVDEGKVERGLAPELIQAATQRYFEETRRLGDRAASEREKVRIRLIDEKFEREKRRVKDEVEAGRLTETDAEAYLDRLIKTKTTDLAAVHEQANSPPESVPETNVNRKSSSTSVPDDEVQSIEHGSATTGSAAARRLQKLENMVIHGGADLSMDTEHCNFIREKLRREKHNAEEKQRRLAEAHKSTIHSDTGTASALYNVFASAHDEIVAKTTALEQLRSQNDHLRREINDIQAEFELDRIDYLDTIRKQSQTLKWFQAVLEQVVPTLRRDANYADLERIRAQSEWDDLNQAWKLPRFSIDRRHRFSLPPAAGRPVPSPAGSTLSSFTSGATADLDYELRSEERLIERLNESAMRDPAAEYFRRSGSSATLGPTDRRTVEPMPVLGASRNSTNPTPREFTPLSPPMSVSPLLRRPRHQ